MWCYDIRECWQYILVQEEMGAKSRDPCCGWKRGIKRPASSILRPWKEEVKMPWRELVAEEGKLFVSCVNEGRYSSTRLWSKNRLWFARAICSICRWLPLRYQASLPIKKKRWKPWKREFLNQLNKAFGPPKPDPEVRRKKEDLFQPHF